VEPPRGPDAGDAADPSLARFGAHLCARRAQVASALTRPEGDGWAGDWVVSSSPDFSAPCESSRDSPSTKTHGRGALSQDGASLGWWVAFRDDALQSLSTWLAGQAIRTIERAIRMADSRERSARTVSDGEFIRSARCGGRLSERQPAVSPSEHRCRSRLLTHARGRPGWRPLSFQKKPRRKPGLSSIGLVTPLQDLVRADPEQCESDLLQHRLGAGESDSWRGSHV